MATIASRRASLMTSRVPSKASLHSLHSNVTAGRSTAPGSLGLTVTERLPVMFRPFSSPDGVTGRTSRSSLRSERHRTHVRMVRMSLGRVALLTVVGVVAAINVSTMRRVWASAVFERSQKLAQTVVLWLVPGSFFLVRRGFASTPSLLGDNWGSGHGHVQPRVAPFPSSGAVSSGHDGRLSRGRPSP